MIQTSLLSSLNPLTQPISQRAIIMQARFKVSNITYSTPTVDVISKGLQKVYIRLLQTNDWPYVLLDGACI